MLILHWIVYISIRLLTTNGFLHRMLKGLGFRKWPRGHLAARLLPRRWMPSENNGFHCNFLARCRSSGSDHVCPSIIDCSLKMIIKLDLSLTCPTYTVTLLTSLRVLVAEPLVLHGWSMVVLAFYWGKKRMSSSHCIQGYLLSWSCWCCDGPRL